MSRGREIRATGRVEALVAWLVVGTAVAWGLSVGITWIEARSFLARWEARTNVALPPPERTHWRAGDTTFHVQVFHWRRHAFEQRTLLLEVADESDEADEGLEPDKASAPAPDWFRRALRRNESAGRGMASAWTGGPHADGVVGDGVAVDGAAAATEPVRRVRILETRGGWPFRTVVNRSVQFVPGITIDAMDTPSLSRSSASPLRLPVFPLPWRLLAMGAAVGLGLAVVSGTVRRAWSLRRLARRCCPACAPPPRRGVGWAVRSAVVFLAVVLAGTWLATIAASRAIVPAWPVDGTVRWEEIARVRGTGDEPAALRRRVIAHEGRVVQMRLAELAVEPIRAGAGAAEAMRPAARWEQRAVRRAGSGAAVLAAEVAVGWPLPAVVRREVLAGADRRAGAQAADWNPPAGPILEPAWPGLLVNAGLVAAGLALVAWMAGVRGRSARLRQSMRHCAECGRDVADGVRGRVAI